jgi:hypothetical protein
MGRLGCPVQFVAYEGLETFSPGGGGFRVGCLMAAFQCDDTCTSSILTQFFHQLSLCEVFWCYLVTQFSN